MYLGQVLGCVMIVPACLSQARLQHDVFCTGLHYIFLRIYMPPNL